MAEWQGGSTAITLFGDDPTTPAKDEIMVQTNCDGMIQVEIVDQLGGTVLTEIISAKNSRINISSLSSGVYMVKIYGDSVSTVKKLVIE